MGRKYVLGGGSTSKVQRTERVNREGGSIQLELLLMADHCPKRLRFHLVGTIWGTMWKAAQNYPDAGMEEANIFPAAHVPLIAR